MRSKKLNWPITLFLLPILVWGLLACGGQSENVAPAEVEAPAETSGEAPAETSAKTEEATASEEPAASDAAPVEAAQSVELELEEAEGFVNVHELPRLSDAEEAPYGSWAAREVSLEYSTSEDIAAVVDFYDRELTALGWRQTARDDISDKDVRLVYRKVGVTLGLSIDRYERSDAANKTNVRVFNHGNTEVLLELPQPADAEMMPIGGGGLSFMYTTPTDMGTIAEFYRRELPALGWQEYFETNQSRIEQNSFKRLETLAFKKDDVSLQLQLGTVQAGPDAGKTNISARTTAVVSDLPMLPEASEVFFKDPAYLIYAAPVDFEEVLDFYRPALAERGWQEYNPAETEVSSEERPIQLFTFNRERAFLTLTLLRTDDERTRLIINTTTILPDGDLPRLADAQNVVSENDLGLSLSYETASDLAGVINFYRSQLAAWGWTESSDTNFRTSTDLVQENQATLFFGLGDAILSLNLNQFETGPTGVNLVVNILPEEAIVQPRTRPEQLPTLAGATDFGYDPFGDLIHYNTASDFEAIIDFYRQEMATLGWQEDNSDIREDTASVDFKKGDAFVFIHISQDHIVDDGTNTVQFNASWHHKQSFTRDPVIPVSSPPDVSTLTTDVSEPADTEASEPAEIETPESALKAQDLPLPADAQGVTYNADLEEITYTSPTQVEALVEFYRQALPEQGWQENEDFSSVDQVMSLLMFEQDEASLSFTIFNIGLGEDTEVTIRPSGLGWEETTAAGSAETDEAPAGEPGELTAIDKNGLPAPSDFVDAGAVSSDFRKEVTGTSAAGISTLVEFYRRELATRGWQEQTGAVVIDDSQANLRFEGPEGLLTVKLSQIGTAETEIALVMKLQAAAEAAGILPASGQARIYFANINPDEVTVKINGQEIKVAFNIDQETLDGVPFIDLAPGKHPFTLNIPGEGEVSDEVEVGPDETWALPIGPGGAFPLQMY